MRSRFVFRCVCSQAHQVRRQAWDHHQEAHREWGHRQAWDRRQEAHREWGHRQAWDHRPEVKQHRLI